MTENDDAAALPTTGGYYRGARVGGGTHDDRESPGTVDTQGSGYTRRSDLGHALEQEVKVLSTGYDRQRGADKCYSGGFSATIKPWST